MCALFLHSFPYRLTSQFSFHLQVFLTFSSNILKIILIVLNFLMLMNLFSGSSSSVFQYEEEDLAVPFYQKLSFIIPVAVSMTTVLVVPIAACCCLRKLNNLQAPRPGRHRKMSTVNLKKITKAVSTTLRFEVMNIFHVVTFMFIENYEKKLKICEKIRKFIYYLVCNATFLVNEYEFSNLRGCLKGKMYNFLV